jgi:hypothetical protein
MMKSNGAERVTHQYVNMFSCKLIPFPIDIVSIVNLGK